MSIVVQPPCQFCKRDLPTVWIQEWDAFLCRECYEAQKPDDKDREAVKELMREISLPSGTIQIGDKTYEATNIRFVVEEPEQ